MTSAAQDDPARPGKWRLWLSALAKENRAWGYRRIQGAISHLGYKVTRSTIAAISLSVRDRTRTRAEQENDVEGVSDATLGTDRSGRLLQGGSGPPEA